MQNFNEAQALETEKGEYAKTGSHEIREQLLERVNPDSTTSPKKLVKASRLVFHSAIAKNFLLVISNVINGFDKFTGCLKAGIINSTTKHQQLREGTNNGNENQNQKQREKQNENLARQYQTIMEFIFVFEYDVQEIDQQYVKKYERVITESWQKQIRAAIEAIDEVLDLCCKNKMSVSKFQCQLHKKVETNFQKYVVSD